LGITGIGFEQRRCENIRLKMKVNTEKVTVTDVTLFHRDAVVVIVYYYKKALIAYRSQNLKGMAGVPQ
jgi:hypothetical protein